MVRMMIMMVEVGVVVNIVRMKRNIYWSHFDRDDMNRSDFDRGDMNRSDFNGFQASRIPPFI
jgi:hypothetical protein